VWRCELWIINGNSCSKKNHSPWTQKISVCLSKLKIACLCRRLSASHQFFWVRLSSEKSSSTRFARRRNLSNLFKSFTIINPCFIAAPYQGAQNVRFFRFVRYLPDRALHIPETKRIKTIRRGISRCLGGYFSKGEMLCGVLRLVGAEHFDLLVKHIDNGL
jgi:hypothetical protein